MTYFFGRKRLTTKLAAARAKHAAERAELIAAATQCHEQLVTASYLVEKAAQAQVARGGRKDSSFDHMIAPLATQRDVFAQASTDKKCAMMGDSRRDESECVIQRSLKHVFATVDALRFPEDASRTGKSTTVKTKSDITVRLVTALSHVDNDLAEGNAKHNIAATSLNLESSRSHALVFLHLTS
ncbi:hypothetical protein PybrP1_010308 [[Pythium] brassicae (nom. inval.)]|nr:hypothetical protein PybrP1_010308 [[Pythium] brassicae (nom. inval.)]